MSDVDPTAPGGMSEAALVVELVEEHHWKMRDAKALSWPEKIEAVAQARLAAEVYDDDDGEAEPDVQDILAEHDGEPVGQVEEALVDAGLDPEEEDDFDSLMADLDLEDDEPVVPLCAQCGEPDNKAHTDHDWLDPDLYETDEEHVARFGMGKHRQELDGELLDDMDDDLAAMTAPYEGVSEDYISDAPSLFIGMPHTRDYIFDGHAGAGPSASERWIACTASLGASRAFLETLTANQQAEFANAGTAARQGTTAHAVGETKALVLTGRIEPEEADARLLELAIDPEIEESYTDEMDEYVAEYVDLVGSYVDERGPEAILIEERVETVVELLNVDEHGDPGLHTIRGSVDLGVVPSEEHPVLVVGDLKYGEGIDVSVDQNPQLRIYALGILARVLELLGIDALPEWLTTVEYHIIQPRLGGIKTYTESVDDLLDWRDEVLSKALTEALGGKRAGAVFNPGEVQCQWCPVRGSCAALTTQRVEQAADLFDVILEGEFDGQEFLETELLPDDRLGALYAQASSVVSLHKALREEVERRLYRGNAVPGYHLVNYTPPRKWKEGAQDAIAAGPKNLTRAERDALFKEPTLVTPTAAEKLVGSEKYAALIEPLVDKPPIRPVVGPVGDRRKAWAGRPPEAMFDIEED